MYRKLIKEIETIKGMVRNKVYLPNEYYDVEILKGVIDNLSEEETILLDNILLDNSNISIYDNIRELPEYMRKLNEIIKNPYTETMTNKGFIVTEYKNDINANFKFDEILSELNKYD